MIVIGLLLVAAGLGIGVLAYLATVGSKTALQLDALGMSASISPLALFLSGVAATVLLWLGWSLLRAGVRRSARRRKETKAAERAAQDQLADAQRQLAHEREQRRAGQPGQVPASSPLGLVDRGASSRANGADHTSDPDGDEASDARQDDPGYRPAEADPAADPNVPRRRGLFGG